MNRIELNGWERLALDWILDECESGGRERKRLDVERIDRFVKVYVVRGWPKDEGTHREIERQSCRLYIGRKGILYAHGKRNPLKMRRVDKRSIPAEFK